MKIEKLKKEIDEQTRNGRKEVYISNNVLAELGYTDSLLSGDRTFVDVELVENLIKDYEKNQFKNRLKVKVKPVTRKQEKQDTEELER